MFKTAGKRESGRRRKGGIQSDVGGKDDIATGMKNRLATMAAALTPSGMLAEQHRKMAESGSAKMTTANAWDFSFHRILYYPLNQSNIRLYHSNPMQ